MPVPGRSKVLEKKMLRRDHNVILLATGESVSRVNSSI